MLRSVTVLLIACLLLASGCARLRETKVTPLRAATEAELQRYLLGHEADVDQFRLSGPFAVSIEKDYQLRLPNNVSVTADLYLSAPAEKAPLVIFLHGYDSSKEDHAYQAMHVATWGMHCLALQLPPRGHWVRNGKTLTTIVNFIRDSPGTIDSRIDPNKIILVGHSFGGSSVAIALGDGAQAAGGILLDPAGIGKELPGYLRRIKAPVMVLGADKQLFLARNRQFFYRFIPSGVAEVSIRGASHEDAQYPSDRTDLVSYSDSAATEEMQITFVSALTATAFSLAATGSLDYAWASFDHEMKRDNFFDARKK